MIASVDDVNELSSVRATFSHLLVWVAESHDLFSFLQLSCLRSLFFRGSDGEDANPGVFSCLASPNVKSNTDRR